MSKQSDNHVDGSINRTLYELAGAERTFRVEEARQKLDQYYADFYRNKIPEKKTEVDTKDIDMGLEEGEHAKVAVFAYRSGYNKAVDLITAQFNSKGE